MRELQAVYIIIFMLRIFKDIRTLRGLKQIELARALGVAQGSVWNWERNGERIRLPVLRRLRVVAGMTWEEFGALIDAEDSP